MSLSVAKFAARMKAFVDTQNESTVQDPQAATTAFFKELAEAIQEMVETGLLINTVTPSPGAPLIISQPMTSFV